jgi:hypothetical protein
MRAFVIHRTDKRRDARATLKRMASDAKIDLDAVFLTTSYGLRWKGQAESALEDSEVVIVFDPASCTDSPNVQWEIECAKKLGKTVVEIRPNESNRDQLDLLRSIHDFSDEFEQCFSRVNRSKDQILELYRTMVQSSEELVQRRQLTNGFFTTLIGGLVAASGFVVKEGVITPSDYWLLLFPIFAGLVLCRSWRNLIDNYGKLNRGKFQVILRLEKELGAEIFSAEWIALGKGLRPSRYRSFTSTEIGVPRLFMALLVFLGICVVIRTDWRPAVDTISDLASLFINWWTAKHP